MGGETGKKVAQLSNPVGQGLYAYNQLTGKDATPKVKYNGAEYSTTGNTGVDAVNTAGVYEANRKAINANNQMVSDLNSDDKTFDAFKNQNQDDLLGKGGDMYIPSYKANKKLAKDQEALVGLFNQRKSEIVARQGAPGMSQTRYS